MGCQHRVHCAKHVRHASSAESLTQPLFICELAHGQASAAATYASCCCCHQQLTISASCCCCHQQQHSSHQTHCLSLNLTTRTACLPCRKCAAGHVSAGGYSIECDACSESTPPLADNSACGCRAGFRANSTEPLTCVQCESPLTYTAKVNRAFVCQQCTPYSYATDDFSSCVCGGGYYAAKVSEDGSECVSVTSGCCMTTPVQLLKGSSKQETLLCGPVGHTRQTRFQEWA
jgi:hypothetical protein